MRYFYLLILCLLGELSHAQDFKFGKVSKEEVLQEVHPQFEEANAAVLFRKQNTYYELHKSSGLTLVTEVHERIKIYDKDGFDWAEKEISYYQNGSDREKLTRLKGYTYNLENGKIKREKLRNKGVFQEEVNDYYLKTKFTMPAVTEGSVIEFRYSLRSPFLTSIDQMPLQYTIPIDKLEVHVRIPEFFGFKKHFNPKSSMLFNIEEGRQNFTYNYTQSHRTGRRVVQHSLENNKVEYLQNTYEISQRDIPPLQEDVYVDYLQNYAASLSWELQFTNFPDSPVENFAQTWEGVTKKIYSGGIERELSREKFFAKDLDKLLGGISDPAQKMVAIFDFVRNKVTWNGIIGFLPENGTRRAFRNGEGNTGDINLMLTAMLQYAGLKANPVLVSTRDNGIPILPTRTGFNYVVAGVEVPGDVILLDATDASAALEELPKRARNWQGRIIRSQGSSAWVDLMPRQQSRNSEMLNLQFDEKLKLHGKSVNILNGLYAKNFRDRYAGLDQNNYVQLLEEDKGNIVISKLEIQNEKKIGEDIRQTYEFQLENALEQISDKIYLRPMVFHALEENPFKADERHYPVYFDFPSVESRTINILVPEGYSVESLPESSITRINGGTGIFKFIAKQHGNFLRIESELSFTQTVFSSEAYEDLKKFYEQMVDKHAEAIVLTKS